MTVDVKICGIKTREALDAAIDGGTKYIGLVFFGKSPRNVDIPTAAELARHARGRAKVVALVVDGDDMALADIAKIVKPDFFQLHGKETPQRVTAIKARFGISVIKAVAVETAHDAVAARAYTGTVDLILFDAKAPKGSELPGGNGLAFDWTALAGVAKTMDFMLSGGLRPETVGDAIRLTGTKAVDVSSGVETAPGVKDPELIRRFLHAVKTAKQT